MKPQLTVFKDNDVNMSFWHKDALDTARKYRFLIVCYGLPSHPYQHNPAKLERLTDEGYVLVYPHYLGTWASDGVMSWEGCVQTVLRTISFITARHGSSAYDQQLHSWDVRSIAILGGSFGASVALVAGAKSTDLTHIIAVAGPTDWRTHSRIPEEAAEPIEELYEAICRGWSHLWRIPDATEWHRLATGTADLNPIDYIEELKTCNVLLIHGRRDPVVSVKRSEELYTLLQAGRGHTELVILEQESHLGNDIIGDERVIEQVVSFLKHAPTERTL
jgi:pimeloyl-ACP methyl ester carboxylesterase